MHSNVGVILSFLPCTVKCNSARTAELYIAVYNRALWLSPLGGLVVRQVSNSSNLVTIKGICRVIFVFTLSSLSPHTHRHTHTTDWRGTLNQTWCKLSPLKTISAFLIRLLIHGFNSFFFSFWNELHRQTKSKWWIYRTNFHHMVLYCVEFT